MLFSILPTVLATFWALSSKSISPSLSLCLSLCSSPPLILPTLLASSSLQCSELSSVCLCVWPLCVVIRLSVCVTVSLAVSLCLAVSLLLSVHVSVCVGMASISTGAAGAMRGAGPPAEANKNYRVYKWRATRDDLCCSLHDAKNASRTVSRL